MAALEGQVALVTGASRGFGRATALRLAREGADVVVNYRASSAAADALAEEVRGLGRRALAVQADVADREAVAAMVKTAAAELGGVDILVNNAGVMDVRPFAEQPPEEWRRMLDVNVFGMLWATEAVLPIMLGRGRGCVVNLASQLGHVGGENFAVYSGTKGFVLAYTRSLAREVGPKGVRVNAVCPGSIITDMNAGIYPEERRRKREAELPLRRMGEPDDVAGAVYFLCSPDAKFITGQCVDVNGGSTMV